MRANMKRAINKKDKIVDYTINDKSFSNKVFWVSFVLLLLFHCVGNTSVIYSDYTWLSWMYAVRNLVYLVLLFKIVFLTAYRKKELFIIFVVFLIGFMSVIKSGSFGIFELFLIMISAKDKNPRNIVAVFAWVKAISILTTLLLAQLEILETLYYLDDAVGSYSTYGFCHRNVLGANVVVVCLAWFYIRYGKIKLRESLAWLIVSIITYQLALSRTSLIVMLLTIVIFGICQKFDNQIRQLKHLNIVVFVGFLLVVAGVIVCTIIYNGEYMIWDLIDSIFTKRFYYANYCYEEYGFSLFGQNLPFVSSLEQQTEGVTKLILDNSYMRALLYYGCIPGGILLVIYSIALSVSVNKRDYALMFSLIIFAFYGLSETYMIDAFYQFPIIVSWALLFSLDNKALDSKVLKVYWHPLGYNAIRPIKYLIMVKYSMLWYMMNALMTVKAKLTGA